MTTGDVAWLMMCACISCVGLRFILRAFHEYELKGWAIGVPSKIPVGLALVVASVVCIVWPHWWLLIAMLPVCVVSTRVALIIDRRRFRS